MLIEKIPFKSLETSFCLKGFFLLLLLFFPPQFCLQKGYKPHRPQQGGRAGGGRSCTVHCCMCRTPQMGN